MDMAPQCHVRSPGLRSRSITEAADLYLVKWCSNFISGAVIKILNKSNQGRKVFSWLSTPGPLNRSRYKSITARKTQAVSHITSVVKNREKRMLASCFFFVVVVFTLTQFRSQPGK